MWRVASGGGGEQASRAMADVRATGHSARNHEAPAPMNPAALRAPCTSSTSSCTCAPPKPFAASRAHAGQAWTCFARRGRSERSQGRAAPGALAASRRHALQLPLALAHTQQHEQHQAPC
jgi:hypothetical protein